MLNGNEDIRNSRHADISNRLAALLHCVSVLLCLSPLRPFILCLRPRGAAGICSPLPTGMGPTGTPVAGGLKDITVCVCVCMCQSVLKTELHRCEWREVSENEREACRTGCGTCSRRKRLQGGGGAHSHPLCRDFDDSTVRFPFVFFGAGTQREKKEGKKERKALK